MTAYTRAASSGPSASSAASRWLDEACAGHPVPPLLIVVGLAEGYLLDVLEARAPETRVLALEPDRQMADAFTARRDWSQWRSSGRLAHLVHPDYTGANEAWRMFPRDTNACLLMVNPGLEVQHPSTGHAARVAQKILYGVRANAEARRRFAPRYLTNVIRNTPAIAHGQDVRLLRDAFRGVPAVIAAAGPSLDAAIPELAGTTDRALLIAVDTALRPLLYAGIAPQLAVAIDPSTLNARHFHALPDCPDTWLVAESALDRSATAPFDGRTFWLRVSTHHPWPWLNTSGIDVGQVDVWGSVLTAALQVAILAGCDPIVLVGADLAFTGGRPYCRGTTYEFDWAWSLSVGRSLDQAWQHHIDSTKPRAAPDLHGRKTVSSGSLESFRDWIVSRAKKSGRRVINATGDGILFGDGIEQGTLANIASGSVAVRPLETITSRSEGLLEEHTIATQIARARRLLATGDLTASPIADWVEFSGEGFDPSAVGAALEEAGHTLRATSVRTTARENQSARHTPSASVRAVIRQLPEAMARLCAALEGSSQLPVVRGTEGLSDSDRATILVEALTFIRHTCELLEGQPALKLTPHTEVVGSMPASALYEWPEAARWCVEIFEALMGTAWRSVTPRKETFFSDPVVPRLLGASLEANAPRHVDPRHACVLLAVEWIRCVLSMSDKLAVPPAQAVERLIGMESIALCEAGGRDSSVKSTLTLAATVSDESYAVELPIDAPAGALARVLTGAIDSNVEASSVVARIEHAELTVTIGLPRVRFHPRRLTDARVHKGTLAYSVEGGVICSRAHAMESVMVRADGCIEVRHSWPRPFSLELPFGDGGAVAWDHSTGATPSYVMYRRTPDETPAIEELPFTPSLGAWWNGRLYLSYVGSGCGSGRGIMSWAPGEPVRFEVSDRAVYDMHAEGESLVLEPRYVRPDGRPERRLMTEGWTWNPGGGLKTIPLGPSGASSGRSHANGWMAVAYPEADLVTLTADDGFTTSMTVYYPFRLAWIGRSLLVGCVQSGLLLFDNLADGLEDLRRAG